MINVRQQPWPYPVAVAGFLPGMCGPSNPKKENTHKSMGLTLSTAFGPVWLRTGLAKRAGRARRRLHLPLHARRRQMSCGKARGVIKLATNCFSRRFKYTFSILGHNERDCSRPQLAPPSWQTKPTTTSRRSRWSRRRRSTTTSLDFDELPDASSSSWPVRPVQGNTLINLRLRR